jgi:hypothetical protein
MVEKQQKQLGQQEHEHISFWFPRGRVEKPARRKQIPQCESLLTDDDDDDIMFSLFPFLVVPHEPPLQFTLSLIL